MIAGFRREIRPMLRLATPLALAELGWMTMGFVDVIMAGRIGPAAMGAGGVGGMIFFPIVSSHGRARSRSAASPPTMNDRVASTEPFCPPVTGASRYRTPWAANREANEIGRAHV